MKVVLERLEFTWWNFHIHLLDESRLIRQLLPTMHQMWEDRDEVAFTLMWSALGFPLGMVIGYLMNFAH